MSEPDYIETDIDAELAALEGRSIRDPALPEKPRTTTTAAETRAGSHRAKAGEGEPVEPDGRPQSSPEIWTPRPWQAEVLDMKQRYGSCVVHRRGGKSDLGVHFLKRCLQRSTAELPRVIFLGATLKSVKRNVWGHIKRAFGPAGRRRAVKRYNEHDLTVEFNVCLEYPHGGIFECLSSTNFQTHRGTEIDGLVVDEVDLIPPSAFDSVFRPALIDRRGPALFIGTPLGRGHLYQRWLNATKMPKNWASWKLDVYQTGLIDDDELEDLQATMPDDKWHQEMMVDFDVPHPGAFYGKQMNEAAADGRLAELAHPLDQKVTAAWHLGKRDDVVVTFWRKNGGFLDCFDSIWEQRTSLGDIKLELERRDYQIERHVVPGALKDIPGARIDQARAIGIRFKQARPLDYMDRIYATKPLLTQCRFDVNRCGDIIEAMRCYRAEYDELARTFNDRPEDDWSAGIAGAVEAFTTDYNPRRSDWSKPFNYQKREREWRRDAEKTAA